MMILPVHVVRRNERSELPVQRRIEEEEFYQLYSESPGARLRRLYGRLPKSIFRRR